MKLVQLLHHLVIQKILLYHLFQQVIKEIQDQQVLKVFKVLQDLKVQKVKKELLELKVYKVQLDL